MEKIKKFREKYPKLLRIVIFTGIIILLIYIVNSVYIWFNSEYTDNAYVEGDLTFISPEVSGAVNDIFFKENEFVQKGQLLAAIDDTIYKALYIQAKNNFEASVMAVQVASYEFEIAKASLQTAKLDLILASNELNRASALAHDSFSSKKILQDAEIAKKKAELGFNIAQEKVKLQEASKIAKEFFAKSSEEALRIAGKNYQNTKIIAPIAGKLTSNSMRIGGFASAGRPVFAIVPEEGLYVKANFKETQVRKMKESMKAEIYFDAFKDVKFVGVIKSLYPATGSKFSLIPTDNATGNFTKIVQRLPVLIDVEIPKEFKDKIAIGYSAHVTIKTN